MIVTSPAVVSGDERGNNENYTSLYNVMCIPWIKRVRSDLCRKADLNIHFQEQWKHVHQFNTFRPRQDGRHFAADIYKCIFLNKNTWLSVKIPLKFVPKGPINNIPALVQIMAWRRPGDKPLFELMLTQFTDAYMRPDICFIRDICHYLN